MRAATILLPLSALLLSFRAVTSVEIRALGLLVEIKGKLEDESSFQKALYTPAPSEGNGNGNGNSYGQGKDRDLAEHESRELRNCNGCPYICCWLCQGFPPGGSCYIWTWAFGCSNYQPSCCSRRRLEGLEEGTVAEVESHGVQMRELRGESEECKEMEGQEAERIAYARLLMMDWELVADASMKCIEIVLTEICKMKFNDYKELMDGKDWDKETENGEKIRYEEFIVTCSVLEEKAKAQEKEAKEAEKAAEEAAKAEEKAAEEAAKAEEKEAEEAEKAAEEAAKAEEKAAEEAAKAEEKAAEEAAKEAEKAAEEAAKNP